jgi:hypothetical protein
MSIEAHEWQREKDKKTYLKMLEYNNEDIKDAYYDPKQFRGNNASKRQSRFSFSVILCFIFGILLISFSADLVMDGKIKIFIKNQFQDNILSIDDLTQSPSASLNENKKVDAVFNIKFSKCTSGYASIQDVNIYDDYAGDLIKMLDAAKSSFELGKLSKNEKIASYNKLVIHATGAIDFHNKKLTRCFSNIAIANDITKKTKTISDKLQDLNSLLR